jgi:glycosyltransferase involved in cell wall biosynthesis
MNSAERPGGLRKAFLVSFHALPAAAVGGLRLSMLAEDLSGRGIEVHLFSACTDEEATGRSLDARVHRHQIEDRRRSQRLIIATVRWFRRIRARANSVGASSPSRPSEARADASRHHFLQWLRRHYFRVSGVLDDNKWWSVKLVFHLIVTSLADRPDVIIVSGPPFSAVAATALVAQAIRVPLVIDFRDPWLGRSDSDEYRGFRERVDRSLERVSIKRARALITTAPSLARTLKLRYADYRGTVHAITNGYDSDALIDVPPPTGRLEILFAGSIYNNRSPMQFLEALARLIADPAIDRTRIGAVFAGHSDYWQGISLREWTRNSLLDGILRFCGVVSRLEVTRLTERANVLLNFAQAQPQQIPAKLFEQLASSRTILLFAESHSDSAALVANCAQAVLLGDEVEQIEAALRWLYNAYVLGSDAFPPPIVSPDARFSRKASCDRLLHVLENARG